MKASHVIGAALVIGIAYHLTRSKPAELGAGGKAPNVAAPPNGTRAPWSPFASLASVFTGGGASGAVASSNPGTFKPDSPIASAAANVAASFGNPLAAVTGLLGGRGAPPPTNTGASAFAGAAASAMASVPVLGSLLGKYDGLASVGPYNGPDPWA